MNRPWMPFHTRDWLDNKELRRCSPLARAVLLDLMCLAHEGIPYGFIADKVGGLTIPYCASRCFVSKAEFTRALAELQAHGRVQSDENGRLFIGRMVEDERVRLARAAGGVKGGNPALMHVEVIGKVNLTPQPSTQPCSKLDSRARMRADSDSGFSFSGERGLGEEPPERTRSPKQIAIADATDRMYAAHPKKKNMALVFSSLERVTADASDIAQVLKDIEECHAAWCKTESWTKQSGNFAPKLDEWISDRGFTKWPDSHPRSRPQPIPAAPYKTTPLRTFGKANCQ